MLKKYSIYLALLISLYQTIIPKCRIVVWDFGYTLAEISDLGIAKEIGWGTCIKNFLQGTGSPKYLRNTMYDILLNGSGCQQIADPHALVRDANGIVLPLIMADYWLTNKVSVEHLLDLTESYINLWDTEKKFRNATEKKMFQGIMRAVFSPDIIARHTVIMPAALALVKKCAEHGSQNYILSNFERTSFEEIFKKVCAHKKHNKLFTRYIPRDKIILSGDCGMVKPHHQIFTYFIEKYNLNPAECVFIDDQEENVLAARACGLSALHLQNGDYKKLEKELKILDAL